MPDMTMWHSFLFFCLFFAMVRVLLVMVYLQEQWPPDVPYNGLHDYGLAKVPQRRIRESLHRLDMESYVSKEENKIHKSQETEENTDNFKNLTKEEKKMLKRGVVEQPHEHAVVWKKKVSENVEGVDEKTREEFAKNATEEFMINSPAVCPNEGAETLLLIMVHSLPRNGAQRDAVRDTWGNMRSVLNRTVRRVFFAAGLNPSQDVMRSLWAEAYRSRDLIFTRKSDSAQAFRSSSKALLSQFRWVLQYCSKVKFVLFVNEEMFVNLNNTVARMKNQEKRDEAFMKNFILGRVKKKARPERNEGAWDYVPESVFPDEIYPNYCIAGAGFILSPLFIKQVYPVADEFLRKAGKFPLSDVMLGIATDRLKKKPMYNDEFRKMGAEAVYCDLKGALTLGDFNSPFQLRDVWLNFTVRKTDHCPNPVPNITEVEEWTGNIKNKPFLDDVMRLIHNPEELCRGDDGSADTFLLALVSTHPSHFDLREAIRQTWSNPSYQNPLKVKTLFVMGRPLKETEESRKRILKEFEEHGDLVQAQFRESFHNLTLKVILGLRWTSMYCLDAAFVYKGDDDMLVNFGFLTEFLKALPVEKSEGLFLGHMMTTSPVIRTPSKYKCRRDQYPFKYFLPYFSGGGYIMSKSSVKKMYEQSLTTKFIPIDDAYAGILAFRSKIKLTHSGNFITTGFRKDHCRLMTAFNMHGFKKTSVMLENWHDFLTKADSCES